MEIFSFNFVKKSFEKLKNLLKLMNENNYEISREIVEMAFEISYIDDYLSSFSEIKFLDYILPSVEKWFMETEIESRKLFKGCLDKEDWNVNDSVLLLLFQKNLEKLINLINND